MNTQHPLILRKEIYDLGEFNPWSGANHAWGKIIGAGLGEEFIQELSRICPEGIDEDDLNDMLWFDEEYCFSLIGLDKDGNLPENHKPKNHNG